MGCIGTLLYILLFMWLFRWVFIHLITPFLAKHHTHFGNFTTGATRDHQSTARYLDLLMPLLAKIAKCDGRVSEEEVERISRIFTELRLSDDEIKFAIAVFNQSKHSQESFESLAIKFAQGCHNTEACVVTLQFMARVATADGTVSSQEIQMLMQAAKMFGIPHPLAILILRQHGIPVGMQGGFGAGGFGQGFQQGFQEQFYSRQRTRSYTRSTPSREEDLALLGLSPSATADDIKKAYRAKAKELHPDKLQSQGLPEAMLKQASERLAEINAAYERLK